MEDFGQLDKIFSEIINQSIETKKLNVGEFFQQMEAGFKSCGFRQPSAMRGGGTEKYFNHSA